jgi:hypothetical protein
MEEHFDQEFQMDVPAKGLFGDPPSRERTFQHTVPNGFTIRREANASLHGAQILHKNLESMDEQSLTFEEIANGVRFTWKVENPHSGPINGRTAFITIRLVGKRENVTQPPFTFSPKYQGIRQRFLDRFYYQGHVAEFVRGKHIKFADQTIYMGQTLIFLATEAQIKSQMHEDTRPSLQLIEEIFAAVEQLDQDAETLYGHTPSVNGFVARDNIRGVDDPRLKGRFTTVESDWQKPEDAAPSGDQIFGLLFGLWFVEQLVEDGSLVAQAKKLADRLFLYAMQHKFELELPTGEPVKRGGDMRWLASLLHGLNKAITGKDRFDECRISVLGQDFKLNPLAAFWDNTGEDAAEILRTRINIPLLGEQTINSFAAHILLMAIAPSDIWSQEQLEDAALGVNHHLAILTYALAHHTKPRHVNLATVQAILELCPDTGPRSDLSATTGWQKDNRWIRCKNIFEANDGHDEYNGVDFLILHNLAVLGFA